MAPAYNLTDKRTELFDSETRLDQIMNEARAMQDKIEYLKKDIRELEAINK